MNQQRCQLQGDFPRKIELLLIILTGAASGQEIAARVEPLQRRTHRGLQPDGLAFPTKGGVSVKDELLKLLPLLPVEVVADEVAVERPDGAGLDRGEPDSFCWNKSQVFYYNVATKTEMGGLSQKITNGKIKN